MVNATQAAVASFASQCSRILILTRDLKAYSHYLGFLDLRGKLLYSECPADCILTASSAIISLTPRILLTISCCTAGMWHVASRDQCKPCVSNLTSIGPLGFSSRLCNWWLQRFQLFKRQAGIRIFWIGFHESWCLVIALLVAKAFNHTFLVWGLRSFAGGCTIRCSKERETIQYQLQRVSAGWSSPMDDMVGRLASPATISAMIQPSCEHCLMQQQH